MYQAFSFLFLKGCGCWGGTDLTSLRWESWKSGKSRYLPGKSEFIMDLAGKEKDQRRKRPRRWAQQVLRTRQMIARAPTTCASVRHRVPLQYYKNYTLLRLSSFLAPSSNSYLTNLLKCPNISVIFHSHQNYPIFNSNVTLQEPFWKSEQTMKWKRHLRLRNFLQIRGNLHTPPLSQN